MTLALQAQCQTVPNSYVQEAFSANMIAEMAQEHIEYLNYISQHAWIITDVPEGKKDANLPLMYKVDNESKQTLSSYFACSEINSFNILKFSYSIRNVRNHYKIDGCEKWLVIKSHEEITNGFNEFRNN